MTIELANKLIELRKKNNLSQEDLADKLNVSRQAVSKWERAEASPDTDNLIELAKLYNVSLDELLGLDSPKNEETVVVDKETKHTRRTGRIDLLISLITTLLVVVTYILLGHFYDAWSISWPIFFLIIIIPSISEAILKKNPKKFAYPIFLAGLYLTICVAISPLWHPLWVIFLTIPIYYLVCDLFMKRK